MQEIPSRYRVLEQFAQSVLALQLEETEDLAKLLSSIKRQAKEALNHKAPLRNEKLSEARAKATASSKRKAAEFRASIVPMIKQARKDGCESTRQIAEWLNKQGFRTSRGFTWSSVAVHRILVCDG
ncbi:MULTISPECIES: recombinase family protein [unclassified Bradyrhizobium]|uniref:recombinase family protein n=1 Tax=unclassified Bradyrhizobium TaxID=2631580 RepID=UPI001FF86194|nr:MULTISPECIES: recombinase family protein [unclassified Bradyrhizobium]MCK1534203.1 recombinase family protein [Bradyrhizobium sp. 176]MCK1562123.1 recombinase family protein [Bradyrhizobium sp. 171]